MNIPSKYYKARPADIEVEAVTGPMHLRGKRLVGYVRISDLAMQDIWKVSPKM